MQTFLKSILILHENREKSKLFKQIYRLKLAFSHTSCIYFTELHLTFHLTQYFFIKYNVDFVNYQGLDRSISEKSKKFSHYLEKYDIMLLK